MPRLPAPVPAAALLALLLGTSALAHGAEGSGLAPVPVHALAARLQQPAPEPSPQVLDVRTPEEYAAGHVPGARLIPHDQVAARVAELDPARPVVVYCRSGRRSLLAEDVLRKAGFDVAQLEGSWQAWQAAGLPVECPEGSCASPPAAKP